MSVSFSAQKGTPVSKRRSGTSGDTSFRATTPRAALSPAPTPLQTVTSSNMPGIGAVDASFLDVPIVAPRASTPRDVTHAGVRAALAAAADDLDNEDAELESVTQGAAAKRNTSSFASIPPRGVAETSDSFEQPGKKVSDNYLTWDKKLAAMQETADTLTPQKKQEIIDALYLYIQGTNFKGGRFTKPTTITGLFRELRERYTEAKSKRNADAKFEIIQDFAAAYDSVERIAERKIRSVALPSQVTPSSATPTRKSKTSTPSHGALRPPSPRKVPSRGTSPAVDLLSRRLEDSFGDEDVSLGDSCDRAKILIARLEEAKTNYNRLTAATHASAASRSDRGTINTAINTVIDGFILEATTQVNAIARHKGGTDLKSNYAKLRDLNYQIEDLIEAYYVVLKDAARTDILMKHYAAQRDKFFREESIRQRRQSGSRSGGTHVNVVNIRADLRYKDPDEIVKNLQAVLDNLMLSFNKSYTSHDKLKDVYKQIYLIQKEERKELISLLEEAKRSLRSAEVQIQNKDQITDKIDNYIQELKDANLPTKDPIFARSGSKRQTTPDGYYLEMNVLARDALLSKVASFYNSVRLVLNGGKVESLDVDIQAEPLVEALEPIVLSVDKFIAIIAELRFHRKQVATLWRTNLLLKETSVDAGRHVEEEYKAKNSQIEQAFADSRVILRRDEKLDATRIEELHKFIHAQQRIMTQDLDQIKDLPEHVQELSGAIADLKARLITVDNKQYLAEIYGRINEVHSQLISELKAKIAEYESADASGMLRVLQDQLSILQPGLSSVKDQRDKALRQINAIQAFSNDQARNLEILPILHEEKNCNILRDVVTRAMKTVAESPQTGRRSQDDPNESRVTASVRSIESLRRSYGEILNRLCNETMTQQQGLDVLLGLVISARDTLNKARHDAGIEVNRGLFQYEHKPQNFAQFYRCCRELLSQERANLFAELDFALKHVKSRGEEALLLKNIKDLKAQLVKSLQTQEKQVIEAQRGYEGRDLELKVNVTIAIQALERDASVSNTPAQQLAALTTAESAHSANAAVLINFYKTRLAELQKELDGLRADKDKGSQDGSTAAEQARAAKAVDEARIAELEREIARLNATIKKNEDDLLRIRDERDHLKALLRNMGMQASILRATVINVLERQQSYLSKIQPQPGNILTQIAEHLKILKAQRDAATATAAASASPQRRGSPESDSLTAEVANMPAIREADNLAHANAQKILELEIASLRAEMARKDDDIRSKDRDINAQALKIAALEAELAVLRRQDHSKEAQELANAIAELAVARKEIDQLKKAEKATSDQLRDAITRAAQLEEKLRAAELNIAQLTSQLKFSTAETQRLTRTIEEIRGERTRESGEAAARIRELEELLQAGQQKTARLEEQVKAANERAEDLTKRLQDYEKTVTNLRAQLATETTAKNDALREAELLRQQLATSTRDKEMVGGQVEALKLANQSLVAERDAAKEDLQRLQLEMATLRAENNSLKEEHDGWRDRVTKSEAEVKEARTREANFTETIQRLEFQLQTSGGDKDNILRALGTQLQIALKYAREKVGHYVTTAEGGDGGRTVRDLHIDPTRRDESARKLIAAFEEIVGIIGEIGEARAIGFQQLNHAQTVFGDAIRLIIRLREDQRSYSKRRLEDAERTLQASQTENKTLLEAAGLAAQDAQAAREQSRALQGNLDTLQQKYDSLDLKLKVTEEARNAAAKDAQEKTQQFNKSNAEVLRLTADNATLSERAANLEAELTRVKAALVQAEQDRVRLGDENQQLRAAGGNAAAQAQALTEKDKTITELRTQSSSLNDCFRNMNAELEKFREQLRTAQEEKREADRLREVAKDEVRTQADLVIARTKEREELKTALTQTERQLQDALRRAETAREEALHAKEQAEAVVRDNENTVRELVREREELRLFNEAPRDPRAPGFGGYDNDLFVNQLQGNIAELRARERELVERLRAAQDRIIELGRGLREQPAVGVMPTREVIRDHAADQPAQQQPVVVYPPVPPYPPYPPVYNLQQQPNVAGYLQPPVFQQAPAPAYPAAPAHVLAPAHSAPPTGAAFAARPSRPRESDIGTPRALPVGSLFAAAPLPAVRREIRNGDQFVIFHASGHKLGQPLWSATEFLFSDGTYVRETQAGRDGATDAYGNANVVAKEFISACNKILKYQNEVGLRGGHPQPVNYFSDLWQNRDARAHEYQLTPIEMRTFITMMCYTENERSGIPQCNIDILHGQNNITNPRNQDALRNLFTQQMANFCTDDYLRFITGVRGWQIRDERAEHRGKTIPLERDSANMIRKDNVANLSSYLDNFERESITRVTGVRTRY